MGVRSYDPARGLWLSPDLYVGRNFDEIVKSPLEANLFQYAKNNPIVNNDPTGMLSWGGLKDKINDAVGGKVGGGGHDMSKSPSSSGGGLGGRSDNKSSSSKNDSIQGVEKATQNSNGGFKDWLNAASSTASSYGLDLASMGARINTAISSPEMGICGVTTALGLSTLAAGSLETATLLAAAPPSAGLSLMGTPATVSVASVGLVTTFGGLGCMTGIIANAAMGGGEPKNNYTPPGNPTLPRDPKSGEPSPSTDAPHTQIGVKKGRNGDYRQTRQWGENGKLQKTTDWTNHGRKDHVSPHDHFASPNTTGGTPKRDNGVPWELTL